MKIIYFSWIIKWKQEESDITTKIKKLKLWLSSSLLTILPIVSVISCSSTSDKIDDKIDTEELEKPSMTTKDISSGDAVARITNARSPQEKREALTSFANVPHLPIEFDFEVLSAIINNEVNSIVEVAIKIFEIENRKNSKNVVLRITGFKADSDATLESELEKFNITIETINPEIAAEIAAECIEIAPTSIGKLEALRCVADIPMLDERFDFQVLEAEVNNDLNTTVDVLIRIFEIDSPEHSENVVFKITGLTTRLDIQTALFKKPATTTKPGTASELVASIIEYAQSSQGKLNALNNFVNVPTIDGAFDFEILFAMVNTRVETVVDVIIRVFEKNNTENEDDVVFQITGLSTHLQIQAAKFDVSIETSKPDSTWEEIVLNVENAQTQVEKLEALKHFISVPVLDEEFDFKILQAMVNSENDTEVDVVIQVFEIDDPDNLMNVSLKITGFKSTSL
ncbi:MAG: hypothetical protein ACRCXE_00705 [Metamycoplasmataceae bacterium]